MEFQYILANQIDGVLEIKLNRPEVLNSFIMAMAQEVQQCLDNAATNPEIRAVYITGEGKGFCAGQDLSEAIKDGGPKIEEIVQKTYNPIITKIRALEKPVVCGVNGVAAGAGANIAFACDITISAESASYIQAFSKIGLVPDSGGTFFLPRLIGLQRATALTMLADKITAEEAKQMGLIYKVVKDEELYQEGLNLAKKLAEMPTVGLGLTKRALNESMTNNLEEQLEVEAKLQDLASKSSDHQEGVNAFLEKRKPIFTGK